MRHGKYGITTNIDLSDEQIELELSKEALKELEKAAGNSALPVTYMVDQEIKGMEANSEFTVVDMFVAIHANQINDSRVIKVQTLRTTLANIARKGNSPIEVAEKASKSRLYKVK